MSRNNKNPSTSKAKPKKSDNTDKPKTRSTINASIPKRNFEELNAILNSWDEEKLNLSSEVCKSILFKHEFENNPITQTILSTLNLIKISLKNKKLFDNSYNEALFLALNNIISIKIDANELSNFMEDDFYFSKYSNDKNLNEINNVDDTKNIEPINIVENVENTETVNTIENIESVITTTQETCNDNPTSDTNSTISNNNIIKWDIPETPLFSQNKGSESNNVDKINQHTAKSSVINNQSKRTSNKQISYTDKIEALNKRLEGYSYPTN